MSHGFLNMTLNCILDLDVCLYIKATKGGIDRFPWLKDFGEGVLMLCCDKILYYCGGGFCFAQGWSSSSR